MQKEDGIIRSKIYYFIHFFKNFAYTITPFGGACIEMQYWIVFLAAFWIFILFLERKFPCIIGFFDGVFLSFLCFCFLPIVLEGRFFWSTSFLLVAGVLISSFLEQKTNDFGYGKKCYALLHCGAFTLAVFLWNFLKIQGSIFCLPFAFLSGLFLLLACGGILPEEKDNKKKMKLALLGVIGFLSGIIMIFPI